METSKYACEMCLCRTCVLLPMHLCNSCLTCQGEDPKDACSGYVDAGKPQDYGDQNAKADAGKPQVSLVPPQIILDITKVREYGNAKYHDPDNWKTVEPQRYVDALLRHTLAFMRDPHSVDDESGIEHYKHMACNLAFLCEIWRNKE